MQNDLEKLIMCGCICKDKMTVLDEEVSEHASVMCHIQQVENLFQDQGYVWSCKLDQGDVNDQAMDNVKIVFELLAGSQNIKPFPRC